MHSILWFICSSIVLTASYIVYTLFLQAYFSPLRRLPGPEKQHIISGNHESFLERDSGEALTEWFEAADSTVIKYPGWFGATNLSFTDPLALNHILMNAYNYPHPPSDRGILSLVVGHGLTFSEGENHKRQRRIMNPAFSPTHLKGMYATVSKYCYQLCEKWQDAIATSSSDVRGFATATVAKEYETQKREGEIVIEVNSWLNRTALDIIGLIAFGYEFHMLDEGSTTGFGKIFESLVSTNAGTTNTMSMVIMRAIGHAVNSYPWVKDLPLGPLPIIKQSFEKLEGTAMAILQQKKEEVRLGGMESLNEGANAKDLLTLMLKSSMTDGKSQMTDDELSGQMTTFILAGHETTATATTWGLHQLACHQDVQTKLREELRAAKRKAAESGRDELSYEEVMALPYLEAFSREILRFRPPVGFSSRIATKDDVIPLYEPLKLKSGEVMSSIFVPAGTVILLSHNTVNTDKRIFGPDAKEFRPERWLDGSAIGNEKAPSVGTYHHMLTFLNGPRNCIGYRFAIMELKTLFATTVANFLFELRDDEFEVKRQHSFVTRPLVKGEENLGFRMPLRVSLAKEDE